ncbi:hypothetical protein TFLX_04837 [Thermoflexales bacterium]|nr:hypothetical protein TFLX_04837 [Thermoflexales bacterium]
MSKAGRSIILGRCIASGLFVTAALLACLSSLSGSSSAQPARRSTDWQPGDYTQTLYFDGLTRTYLLHLPTAYTTSQELPLIIVLHGGGGNADNISTTTGMSGEADRRSFIVVYPEGTGAISTWDAVHCCGYALANNIDDVGFIRALIQTLTATLAIDSHRIYAAGFSNGAMLTYRLGADLSDVLAAIAPVAGTIGGQATDASPTVTIRVPDRPMPIIAFHGRLDQNVLYDGGHGTATSGTRVDLAVSQSITFWVQHNGCAPTPQSSVSASANITTETYTHCRNQTDVILYTIGNQGHAWPGGQAGPLGDDPTHEITATSLIYDFFMQHPRLDQSIFLPLVQR